MKLAFLLLTCCVSLSAAAQDDHKQIVPIINSGAAPMEGIGGFVKPPSASDRAIYAGIKAEVTVGGRVYPGTVGTFRLLTGVRTGKNKAGDPIEARLLDPVRLPTGTVVPAGTLLQGEVEQSIQSGHGTPNSAMTFHFSRLKDRNGQETPVIGRLAAATMPRVVRSNSVGMGGEGMTGSAGSDYLVAGRNAVEEAPYRVAREIGPGAIVQVGGTLEVYQDSKLFVILVPSRAPQKP